MTDLFDKEPQLTDPKHGPEPSLRNVLRYYYTSYGIDGDEADSLVKRYIEEITKPAPPKYGKLGPDDELWDADENCDHEIMYPPGGGMKCHKCGGWFCY